MLHTQSLASHKRSSGFTLIELLVVVAIIGVLATIVVVSVSGARASARDAKRRSDLKSLQFALELYYRDNGTYIVSGSGYGGGGQGWFGYEGPNYGGNYTTAVSHALYNAGFLARPIVDDPQSTPTSPGYMIYICNNGGTYAISATLENPTANDIADLQTSCNGTGANSTYTTYGKNFAVHN